jgi:hypothetical protein
MMIAGRQRVALPPALFGKLRSSDHRITRDHQISFVSSVVSIVFRFAFISVDQR